MRIYLHISLILCLLISVMSCDGGGGSSSDNPSPVSLRNVTVNPATARPGNPVYLQNFPSLPSGYEWTIALGDNIVPLMINETEGFFAPAPLIFKDGSNWPETPAQPLDLVLYRDGVEEDRLAGVLTLEPLLRADGSSDAIEQSLININTHLTTIGDAFAPIPGEHQQYMNMVIETFNQMLTGDCDYCLKTQLDLLAREGDLELLDALLAEGGIVDYFANLEAFLTQYANGLVAVQASFTPPSSLIQPAFATPEQTDVMLAYQMQFYEVLKLFGEQVIAATGTTFGNTLGSAVGLLGALGVVALPVTANTLTITSAILFYLDYIVNKIMVGLLPAQLDKIDLEFDSLYLNNDEVTDSTITIHAGNIQPQLTLNELIGTAITMMGWTAGTADPPQVVEDTLLAVIEFIIFTMQSFFTQYASGHPELNLQINIGSIVPPITWTAKATDERLTKCISFNSSLLTPMPDQLNWKADDTLRGEGSVYVHPALGDGARIVPLPIGFTYTGGAFGNNVMNSNIVSLTVAIVITIIDNTLYIGDDAALIQYDGTAAIPNASEFTTARLEVRFLGNIPGVVSGIDLSPDPVQVVVNGTGHTVTAADIPNISGCSVEWHNFEGERPAPCIFSTYECPFTYKLNIINIIIPDDNNSVSILSGTPPSNWCGGSVGYDNFAIGSIRIILE